MDILKTLFPNGMQKQWLNLKLMLKGTKDDFYKNHSLPPFILAI